MAIHSKSSTTFTLPEMSKNGSNQAILKEFEDFVKNSFGDLEIFELLASTNRHVDLLIPDTLLKLPNEAIYISSNKGLIGTNRET